MFQHSNITRLMNCRRCVINNPSKKSVLERVPKASLMKALNVIKGARSEAEVQSGRLASLETCPHTVHAAGLSLRMWFYPTALGQGLSQCVSFYVHVFCDKVFLFWLK